MRGSSFTFSVSALVMAFTASAGGVHAALTEVDIGINPTFSQTGPTTVTSTGGFFAARAFLDSASDFDTGTLTYPGAGSPATLTPQPGPILGYSVGNPSFSDLNTAFPLGAYTFALKNTVTLATQSASIDYSAIADPLSTPQLTAASYNGLQGLNAASGIDLSFNSFLRNPSGNAAFVFFNVFDSTGVDVFAEGFLDPSTTRVFLPGKTLVAGQSYTFDLIFDDRITGSDGTTPNTIFFDAHTDGTFNTAAAVPEPASWALILVGFGLVGAVSRRRSVAVAAGAALSSPTFKIEYGGIPTPPPSSAAPATPPSPRRFGT